ncbi:hypothetical protein AR687_15275 [Flavobacteriaceae bacterium CRH]|nr:hypothetical protein AR687_15275 [Flavobacteriaceae bacterium CRH]
MSYCKKNSNIESISIVKSQTNTVIKDTTINDINSKFIGKKILGEENKRLIEKYKLAITREVERPQMVESFLSNIDSLFEISQYKTISIDSIKVKSYIVQIHFEDAYYSSILIILDKENYPYNCLVVYENLESEENYKCYSKINENIITINRISNLQKGTEKYILKQNNFLNYYDNSKIEIPEWGSKELLYTKDGLDSFYQYQYILEGKIKNHLKNGEWSEKRFIPEYIRSVWINGKYINGLRDGEWNYSPDGPVDKIEVYDMGKLIKTYFP